MVLNPNVISATPDTDENGNPIPPTTQPVSGGSGQTASPVPNAAPAVSTAPQTSTANVSGSSTPTPTSPPSLMSSIQNAIGPNPTTLPPTTQQDSYSQYLQNNQNIPTANSAPPPQTNLPTPTAMPDMPSITQAPITTPAPTTATNPGAYNNVISSNTANPNPSYNNILTAIQGNVQETQGQQNQDANYVAQNAGLASQFAANAAPTTPTPIVTPAPTDYAAQVLSDYQKYLGRTPSQAEMQYYVQQAISGISPTQIQNEFFNSPEFRTKNAALVNQIDQDYSQFLGRTPSNTELDYYIQQAINGNPIQSAWFQNSPEYLQDQASGLIGQNGQYVGPVVTTIAPTLAPGQTAAPTTTLAPGTVPTSTPSPVDTTTYQGIAPNLVYPPELPPSSNAAGYGAGGGTQEAPSTPGTSTNMFVNLLGGSGNNNPVVSSLSGLAGGIAGSIAGTAIGGAIGGTLLGFEAGSVIGPIGAIAGAIIGTVISGLFGPKPSVGPNATAQVTGWNAQTNAPTTITSEDNGGNAAIGTQLANATGLTVGSIVNALGGTMTGFPPIQIGYFKGKFFVGDGASGATYQNNEFSTAAEAIADATYRSIQNMFRSGSSTIPTNMTAANQQALLNLTPQEILANMNAQGSSSS